MGPIMVPMTIMSMASRVGGSFEGGFGTRPISLLTLLLLRLLDPNFPGTSLWDREFQPLELRLCLSQAL